MSQKIVKKMDIHFSEKVLSEINLPLKSGIFVTPGQLVSSGVPSVRKIRNSWSISLSPEKSKLIPWSIVSLSICVICEVWDQVSLTSPTRSPSYRATPTVTHILQHLLATSPIRVNSCFEQLQPWERWDCLCYYDDWISLNQSRILFTFAQSRWQTCIFFFGGNLWEIQRISS